MRVQASGLVTGALSKPSGTPVAGGDAEDDDESDEVPL